MSLTIPYVITLFLASLRLSALILMIPAFSGVFLPLRIRIVLVFLITILIAPGLTPVGMEGITIIEIVFFAVGEILIGLFLGLCVRTFFGIMELAGDIVSRNIGLMVAPQFDPGSGSQSNLMGSLFFYFGTLLFFMIGGHHHVIHGLATSFEVITISKTTLVEASYIHVVHILSQIFALAISIAAPFIAVDFIITLGFGVLGKVAPKINVMMLSFSFRIVGGMLLFSFVSTMIFNFLLHYAEEIPMSMVKHLAP
jgi:flagellar biosynthetic protein FliR